MFRPHDRRNAPRQLDAEISPVDPVLNRSSGGSFSPTCTPVQTNPNPTPFVHVVGSTDW